MQYLNILAGIGFISFITFLFFKRKKKRLKKAGVYGIYDKKTKESIYVGCSGDIDKRKKQHKRPTKHGALFYRMFSPKKHYVKVLKSMPNSTKRERLKKESNFIKKERPKRNKRSYKN